MRTYAGLRLSGVLALLGLAAAIVLKGGWQAAGAGLMAIAGTVFLLRLRAVRAARERTPAARRD